MFVLVASFNISTFRGTWLSAKVKLKMATHTHTLCVRVYDLRQRDDSHQIPNQTKMRCGFRNSMMYFDLYEVNAISVITHQNVSAH